MRSKPINFGSTCCRQSNSDMALLSLGCRLPMLTFHHILNPANEGHAAIFDLYSRLGLWKRLVLLSYSYPWTYSAITEPGYWIIERFSNVDGNPASITSFFVHITPTILLTTTTDLNPILRMLSSVCDPSSLYCNSLPARRILPDPVNRS